jgi:transposase-like protein
LVPWKGMPITPTNPFKGRHFPGEVIVQAVRWYLQYPLAYEHVSQLMAERGVPVDASCIWRWVRAYAPEINKRCRPHLKPTNKSYRTDETYIKGQGPRPLPVPGGGFHRPDDRFSAHGQA